MAETFSGDWTIKVEQKSSAFSEQFVIEGSLASDGVYRGDITTPPVAVSGPSWSIRFEWNDNVKSGWQPSAVRRKDAAYTLQDGLVVLLGADDNYEAQADHDFNDLVLRCTNIDSQFNPWYPFHNPYNFTIGDNVRHG